MKKKDVFVSAIKGLITGVSLWINNMSIAAIILSVSSYDSTIEGLSNISKKKNKDLWYVVIPIIIGICFGLLAGHSLIKICWRKYQLQTICMFTGLFIGGIKILFYKHKLMINKKNIYIPTIVLLVGTILIILIRNKSINIENSILNIIVLAIISAVSFLIPATSALSSNIKHSYTTVINSLKGITSLENLIIIILFIIVFIITIIIIAKAIKLLIDKNKNNTYLALCSCIILSIITLFINIRPLTLNFVNIFTSILAFLWGFLFAKNVERE